MEIKHTKNGRGGVFYLEEDGDMAGQMHYTQHVPGVIIIDHTEVSEKYEGRGLGKLLVKAGVEYARSGHIKIKPYCPYAKAIINRTPEYQDVL